MTLAACCVRGGAEGRRGGPARGAEKHFVRHSLPAPRAFLNCSPALRFRCSMHVLCKLLEVVPDATKRESLLRNGGASPDRRTGTAACRS